MNSPQIAGIVVEYNPFHNGHLHMANALRAMGYTHIACVISGPFVQRAGPALFPVARRAQAAVLAGVDLVFRLPAPWALSSAEGFAFGGVSLLSALGVDAVAFGAETPDIEKLQAAARMFDYPEFSALLKQQLKTGVSFAAARAGAAETLLPGTGGILRGANNTLAVEYCKALGTLTGEGLHTPKPVALQRVGVAHDGGAAGNIASASHLRELARIQGIDALAPYVPAACMPVYIAAAAAGEIIDERRFETALISRLRDKRTEDFAPYAGAGEGLAARLAKAAGQATTLEELYGLAKTKRYAHSRVRRVALSVGLALPPILPTGPPFAHLLAASKNGAGLLGHLEAQAPLPLSTSMAKLAGMSVDARQTAEAEAACESLYDLCRLAPTPAGGVYTTPAFFA